MTLADNNGDTSAHARTLADLIAWRALLSREFVTGEQKGTP